MVRARRHDVLRRGVHVEDGLLPGLYAVDVLVERYKPLRVLGGSETEELGGLHLVGRIRADALLEVVAKFQEEFAVCLGVPPGLILHPPDCLARHCAAELADHRAVLRVLSADVEWDVLTVHHTNDKPQPVR
eukprot:385246_1